MNDAEVGNSFLLQRSLLRFNQSLIALLNQVEMMSQPQRAAGEESFEMVVPAMKVRDFNFSSLAKF
jgi:hypothetical protein